MSILLHKQQSKASRTIFLFLIGLLKDDMNILLLLVSFRYVIFQMVESRDILISFALLSVGVGALKFLRQYIYPPPQGSFVGGRSVDYNCTTDDPNATVLLLKSTDSGHSFNVFPVSPNKLLLRKQVFTIVNIALSDQAQYKCKATDQSGQTIQWNTGSMLFVHPGLYENSE